MTWLLLILYVNGAGHSPATLTSIRDFRNVAACEAAAALERRIPARFLRARGSVTLLCVPQHGSRRHG